MMKAASCSTQRGFTLLEVTFCLTLFLIGSLAICGSIIFTRKTLEINKQRLAAMNICRMNMEAIMGLDSVPAGSRQVALLDSDKLPATVKVEYYGINANGVIDKTIVKTGPSLEEPTYARVSIEWKSSGNYNRFHRFSLQSIVAKGLI